MPSQRTKAHWIGPLLVIVACAGCFEGTSKPVHERMLQPAPLAPLTQAEVFVERQAAMWPPEIGPNIQWAWAAPGSRPAEGGGILVEVEAGGSRSLTRAIHSQAADVDALVVRTSEPVKGVLSLYWTPAEDRFRQERSLLAESSVETTGGAYETRFSLRGVDGWEGSVGRVRLVVRAQRGGPVRLAFLGLEALRMELREDLADRLADDARRVTLGDEVRDGLPCLPGELRRWELPSDLLGTAARLRFGFGTGTLADGEVRFELRAAGAEDGDPLWSAAVGREAFGDNAWHDVSVDLAALPEALEFGCRHLPQTSTTRTLAHFSAPMLSPRDPGDERPNIVLVSIDTLRPGRLSLYGYERETSPHLDRWAQRAIVFEQAVTSAPWTLPAHLSMFSGLDATRHGINHPVLVPDDVPLLAARLRNAGYRTVAWVGGGFMSPRFGLDRGFDRYRSWPKRAGEAELEDGLARALEWLESSPPEPYFLFFHTYETHYPYRPREPFYSRWAPDENAPRVRDLAYISERDESFQLTKLWRQRDPAGRRPLDDIETQRLSALYDAGVAYADEQIARLLTRLDEAPFQARTAVVVTSDHGEALGDKGLAGHAYLEEFNSLVPLVLKPPGGAPARRVASQVRIADVAPTLLELAGLAPDEAIDGVSLLPLVDEPRPRDRPASTYAAFSNRGIAIRPDRRWKLVYVDTALEPLAGTTTLFDLAEDPLETSPAEDPARQEALGRLAQREIATMAGAFRVHLDNRSDRPLVGRLSGPGIGPLQIKLAEVGTARVDRDGEPGVRWRVEAGQRLTLLVQNPTDASLVIEEGRRLVAALDHETVMSGWEARRVGGEWSTGAGGGSADASIEIEWPAGLAGAQIDPSGSDEALRRQLEALGYVQ